MTINLSAFKKKFLLNKRAFRSFLTRLENNPPKGLHKTMVEVDKEVWAETECLTCGNCCKKMTPTFTTADIKRIAGYFNMKPDAFKEKWLTFDKKEGDWQNVKQPCQFLNLSDNKCSIYPIRPADCAGFPHLTKKNPTDYLHVHKQNIEYCPATYKMVEKMQERMKK
ncbi:MAG: YkgJ family cysteine cluster protein [Chitinophagaceae bacterium]|nr:YkgJ family cysteine cluster protein [Chitinophagaceae bacterium]